MTDEIEIPEGYTPGEWHVEEKPNLESEWGKASIGIWSQHLFDEAMADPDGPDAVDAMDDAWICGIWGDLSDEDRANARLIALAPQMAAEIDRLRNALRISIEASRLSGERTAASHRASSEREAGLEREIEALRDRIEDIATARESYARWQNGIRDDGPSGAARCGVLFAAIDAAALAARAQEGK